MKVVFTHAARADIAGIFDFISRDDPNSAQQVVGAIERATDRLSQFPQSGRVGAVEATRELVVPLLPYIGVFRCANWNQIEESS